MPYKISGDISGFVTDLTRAAARSELDPLIGRDDEIADTIRILSRRRRNSAILVGEPGTGKTAIAEGLATLIIAGKVPLNLRNAPVLTLDMNALVAGTTYRGDFENRLKLVMDEMIAMPEKYDVKPVLFIDEIHVWIGAGAASGSMDASNIMKPVLGRGQLRCIGATTHNEYRKYFERDGALVRRFGKVEIEAHDEAETIKILCAVCDQYAEHHDVVIARSIIPHLVSRARQHLTSSSLLDESLNLLDSACAELAITRARSCVSEQMIDAMVLRIGNKGRTAAMNANTAGLATLGDDLKSIVVAQDDAMDALAIAVKQARAGLSDPDKPIGAYLFPGPTGVGKTEAAKGLAKLLGVPLLRFDMSECMERHAVSRLIGAPPGYIGFDDGGQLTDKVARHPHCVLLLDEMEKAHPDIFNILLQVMDHGRLTDAHGKPVDFRNVILIMTSNAGAVDMQRERIGFSPSRADASAYDEAVGRLFPPEFRNRLTAIVPFAPLQPAAMLRIVDKFLAKLAGLLEPKLIGLEVSEPARQWLAHAGYDPLMGARPLERVIQKYISQPLADPVLLGTVKANDTVVVSVSDKADRGEKPLCFEFNPKAGHALDHMRMLVATAGRKTAQAPHPA